jgi:cobalt-zinc-cadmium efflux system membrane fusion protein
MSRAAAFLAVLPALIGLAACRKAEPADVTPPPGETWLTDEQIQGARLRIEPVKSRVLALHLVSPGRVAFDEGRVAHVFSPVSGRVTRVLAAFGQRVTQGAALAVIESPDLGSARSDLIKARADLVAAEREFDRQKELLAHQASAERDYEAAQNTSAKARAEVERTQKRLDLLHASESDGDIQQFALRSPLAGEVINRTATVGLEVQGMLSSANVVAELFTVGDIDNVWVWGDLYERDLGRVRPGQTVTISSVAYPDRRITGAVDFVSDTLDKDTHTARFRCVVPNRDRLLKPEMYVTLSLEAEKREALAVPASAIVRSGERHLVFIRDGKTEDGRVRFRERSIDLGEGDDGWISVKSGLVSGENVVVAGSILLSGSGG